MLWSAYMRASVRSCFMQDHLIGNCNPFTVDFHFVVIVNGAYRGRPAVPEIATKEAVGAFQPPVKRLMPFLVIMSKLSFLCDYSVRQKTEYGCEDFVHSNLKTINIGDRAGGHYPAIGNLSASIRRPIIETEQ